MRQTLIEDYLQSHGLICYTFSFDQLPKQLQNSLTRACDLGFNDNYLSLIANAGEKFWNAMQDVAPAHAGNVSQTEKNANPVDEFSITITNTLLNMANLEKNADILYPNRFPVPLMALGEYAGWSNPSPLGLGLHPEFGPWFAYRALIKTTQPLTALSEPRNSNENTSACLTCLDTPCVNACPANAVSTDAPFSINRCADDRVKEDSTCKQQCHARNACPIGREYQYSEEQRAYHMTHALGALIKWSPIENAKPD